MRLGFVVLIALAFTYTVKAGENHWVATWIASPSPQITPDQLLETEKLEFRDQTLREIVHISIAGEMVRLRLSNAYGKTPVEVGSVHIARRGKGPETVSESDRALRFSGRTAVTLPSNAVVLSDPIKLDLPAESDLAISIYLPKPTRAAGIHYAAQQTSYVAEGDVTAAKSITVASTVASWTFLADVEVLAPSTTGAVIAFGDSITDGARSSLDQNRRWPNILGTRLLANRRKKPIAVLDAGIGGNRILHDGASNIRFGVNALSRFEQDVLSVPGAKYVIVLEGINDLGHPGSSAPDSETVSAEDLIFGLKQMVDRAHEKGLKIFGATITPFEGTVFKGYFNSEKEAKRKAVNNWIRTSGTFDGVVDFDAALRDAAHPDHIQAAYDSGDHLHPNDAGYKAMGEMIELSLFK